jgi:hypothetical protein
MKCADYYRWNILNLLFCVGSCSLAAFAVHWREVRRATRAPPKRKSRRVGPNRETWPQHFD